MASYLIDTNHASAFMLNLQPVTKQIAELAQRGERFYLCMTVVGELYFAVYASMRRDSNMRHLQRLLERIAILDFDQAVAQEYGRI
ncbi:MAG: hypothetical protein JXA89_24005 [Anaerolineae bacterium]|nr:hypothetical protein [Anaerolineae bacterium]